MPASTRNHVFTYNNPTHSPSDFQTILATSERVRYSIFQLEEGENGTPHYQGYVEYNKPVNVRFFNNHLCATAHTEKRKGTRDQAREYCRKEDTRKEGPWETGVWVAGGAGKRNDLAGIITACKTGSLKRVAEEHPEGILRYSKVLPSSL